MKKIILNVLCIVVLLAIIVLCIFEVKNRTTVETSSFDEGVEQIDLNTIYLNESGVEVNFSDVILSSHNETRKLIVREQQATVSTELTNRIIKQIDFKFMKKTQTVNYTGKGYFVVDLDKLTKDSIVVDKDKKIVSIKIPHSYLQAVEINPNDIVIDEVQEGLLARGDIELTLRDYNTIEKELRTKLEESFNTVENGQQADDIALKMVKEVYETPIKAIDRRYSVIVEFE